MVASASAMMMLWKSKSCMDPLGSLLFPSQTKNPLKTMSTRSENSQKATIPVPRNNLLAANRLARAWNESNLHNSVTAGAAKVAASKWAQSLQLMKF